MAIWKMSRKRIVQLELRQTYPKNLLDQAWAETNTRLKSLFRQTWNSIVERILVKKKKKYLELN